MNTRRTKLLLVIFIGINFAMLCLAILDVITLAILQGWFK